MREGSPQQFPPKESSKRVQPGAKSLFRKILAVSPCGSRFCKDRTRYPSSKCLQMNILEKVREKKGGGASPGAKLFPARTGSSNQIGKRLRAASFNADNLLRAVCSSLALDGTIRIYA